MLAVGSWSAYAEETATTAPAGGNVPFEQASERAGLLSEVYLNTASGSDASGGEAAASAVKTFQRALELVSDGGSIYVDGAILVSQDLSVAKTVSVKAFGSQQVGTLNLYGADYRFVSPSSKNYSRLRIANALDMRDSSLSIDAVSIPNRYGLILGDKGASKYRIENSSVSISPYGSILADSGGFVASNSTFAVDGILRTAWRSTRIRRWS